MSLLWEELFLPALLSTSPSFPLEDHLSHFQSMAGWGWSQTSVPKEVHELSLGNESIPSPALAQHVILQRIFVILLQRMWYHIPGDIRKRKDSHLHWIMETCTSLEPGSRILTLLFSVLWFSNCLSLVIQMSKSFTHIFQSFKLSTKKRILISNILPLIKWSIRSQSQEYLKGGLLWWSTG